MTDPVIRFAEKLAKRIEEKMQETSKKLTKGAWEGEAAGKKLVGHLTGLNEAYEILTEATKEETK